MRINCPIILIASHCLLARHLKLLRAINTFLRLNIVHRRAAAINAMAAEQKATDVEVGEKAAAVHHNEDGEHRTQADLVQAAADANEEQNHMPKKLLFKQYWPGVTFSMLLSLALVMEGMDVGLINNFFGHPAYLENFGRPNAEGEMEISAKWQGAIANGQSCGQIIGLLLNGYLQARYGSRKVYMVCRFHRPWMRMLLMLYR